MLGASGFILFSSCYSFRWPLNYSILRPILCVFFQFYFHILVYFFSHLCFYSNFTIIYTSSLTLFIMIFVLFFIIFNPLDLLFSPIHSYKNIRRHFLYWKKTHTYTFCCFAPCFSLILFSSVLTSRFLHFLSHTKTLSCNCTCHAQNHNRIKLVSFQLRFGDIFLALASVSLRLFSILSDPIPYQTIFKNQRDILFFCLLLFSSKTFFLNPV